MCKKEPKSHPARVLLRPLTQVRKGLLQFHQELRKAGEVGLDFDRLLKYTHKSFLERVAANNEGCAALVKFVNLVAHGPSEDEPSSSKKVPSTASAVAAMLKSLGKAVKIDISLTHC